MRDIRPASLSLARSGRRYGGQKSSALVIVLACLVFLTVLIVAFFVSISTERQSARFYANTSSVKLLADSAVDIVMGQIKDATKGTDASGLTLAWASQPGMIRTYDTSGLPSAYYKLYSWGAMTGSGAFNPGASSETPPSNWTNMPALYTDLNDPVSGIYPIVDPSATNTVQGFSITNTAPVSSRDAAPMPVQWLYVLKDGSLATATGSSGNTVAVANAAANNPIVARIAFWTDDDTCKVNINTAAGDVWPTNYPSPGQPGNPGSFWDTPRTGATFEKTYLAMNQPTHNEFQRYPGHPATTYLSAVFPGLSTNQLYAITPRVNGGGSDSGTLPVTNYAPISPKTDRLYASVDELLFSTNMVSSNRVVNLPLTNSLVQSSGFFLTAHSRAPEVNLYNEPRVVVWPISSLTPSTNYQTAYDSLIAFDGTLNNHIYYFQRANSMDAVNDLPSTASATGLGRNRALVQYLQNLTGQPVPGFSTNGETFLSKYPANSGNPVNTSATDRDQILTEIFDYVRALNEQDVSSPYMTNSFTPTFTTYVNMQNLPYQSGQITPIYDTVNKTRGFGRFPTVVEAGLLFFGIGQSTSAATNYPPYALNNFYYSSSYPNGTNIETWSPAPPLANLTNSAGTATNCAPTFTRVQAALVVNLFDPSVGYSSVTHNFFVEVDGLSSFRWQDSHNDGYSMFRQDSCTNEVTGVYDQYGGYNGIRDYTDADNGWGVDQAFNADAYSYNGSSGMGYSFPNYSNTLDYLTGSTSRPLNFLGGTVTIKLRVPLNNAHWQGSQVGSVVQQVTITFPKFKCPAPGVAPRVLDYAYTNSVPINRDFRDVAQRFARYGTAPGSAYITDRDVIRTMVLDASKVDPRMIAAMTNVPSSYFTPGPNYYPNTYNAVTLAGHGIVNHGTAPYLGAFYGNLVPNVNYSTNTILTNQATYTGSSGATLGGSQANGLTYAGTTNLQPYAVGNSTTNGMISSAAIPVAFNSGANGAISANGVFAGGGTSTVPGDWDTGLAMQPDGAYINKADEGDVYSDTVSGANLPYYTTPQYSSYLISSNYFSPNREMPSPVMFGSLPTGVMAQKPWQTLLFHPDPNGHLGATSPQDHLLLDLFNMPVVEPYPISDPFSTAGKINMNYQIVPFTYITRSTGIQAVLRSEQILAIPTSDGTTYKTSNAINRRYYLDLNQTLTGFTNMFSTGTTDGTGSTPDIFRSATQICNIWLVPAGLNQTYSSMQSFWNTTTGTKNGAMTGDNIRERPYANIYSRLTTKSNTFTVHYRVQMLKKINSTAVDQWVEGSDIVTGEYRGSSTLERYLDTSDTLIPDYVTASQPLPASQAIDNFYKFRVLETKQFTP